MSNETIESELDLDLDKFVTEQVIEIPDSASSELTQRFLNQLRNLTTTVQELNIQRTPGNKDKITLPTMHPTSGIEERIENLIIELMELQYNLAP